MNITIQPVKRNPSLLNLSREHHYGLLSCWKIHRGLKLNRFEEVKKYAIHFFNSHLLKHFHLEESFIFPLTGQTDDCIAHCMREREIIKSLFDKNEIPPEDLARFVDLLETHIQYEENVVYMHLQEIVPEKKLLTPLRYHQFEMLLMNDWPDKFWEFTLPDQRLSSLNHSATEVGVSRKLA